MCRGQVEMTYRYVVLILLFVPAERASLHVWLCCLPSNHQTLDLINKILGYTEWLPINETSYRTMRRVNVIRKAQIQKIGSCHSFAHYSHT